MLVNHPVVEPTEGALPSQPVIDVLAETDAVPVVEEIVEEAPAAEDALIDQPAAEPVEDVLLNQKVAAPVAADASAGYRGNESVDTQSVAEETSLALAAAATILDDAEMENIFGSNIFRRNWNRNRTISTLNCNSQPVQVNWRIASGIAGSLIFGGIGLVTGSVAGTVIKAGAGTIAVGALFAVGGVITGFNEGAQLYDNVTRRN